jgi:putative acetyltransferase
MFFFQKDNQVIGNIMYTKAKLMGTNGTEKMVLTFGPLSILPEYQRKGLGKALIKYSIQKAKELNYEAIVIFGNPGNYVGSGFKSCRRYDITIENGIFPSALLVRELREGSLSGEQWIYHESDVYNIDNNKVEKFDSGFDKIEKEVRRSQEEFFILSNSRILITSNKQSL